MTDETQNCIQDQIARTRMMDSTTDVQPSGYITSHVLAYNDGVTPNKNGDIFPALDTSNWPITCGVRMPDEIIAHLKHEQKSFKVQHLQIEKNGYFHPVTDHLSQVIDKVVGWHYDRNLIDGSTDKDQTLKLAQELGELSDSVCKGKDIKDDIGDMLVVMLNIAERNGVSLGDCLDRAWDDIKDRKGKMIDGIFVKESDL